MIGPLLICLPANTVRPLIVIGQLVGARRSPPIRAADPILAMVDQADRSELLAVLDELSVVQLLAELGEGAEALAPHLVCTDTARDSGVDSQFGGERLNVWSGVEP